MYREIILEEYKHPQNKGKLEEPCLEQMEHNPLCGDKIHIYLRTKKEGEKEKISEVKFQGTGCAISQASASLFTTYIQNKTIEEVAKMNEKTILELLGIELNPMRMKCAVLVIKATAKALEKGGYHVGE